MTPHERYIAHMTGQPVDRLPLLEWGPWPSTLRRWRREALGPDGEPPQFAECDPRLSCGVDLWMIPRFVQEVIHQNERYVITRSERGIISRQLKDPDGMSMPEHIEYPVRSRKDWDALKERFDPSTPERFPGDWEELCKRWRSEQPILLFQGPRSPSLFGFVRELMGPQRTLYAFMDEPSLVRDMMDTMTALTMTLLERAAQKAPITSLYFWEDMCYKAGPLISPTMFREFMIPRYKQVTELARRLGIQVILVDSDGDVSQLIPLWLEAGLDGTYPLEVAAGMDIRSLRGQYGRRLMATGNIDKRALARDRKAIDAELDAKMPLMQEGGFIAHLDHAIPHNVPYENFAYYWERKKQLLGINT